MTPKDGTECLQDLDNNALRAILDVSDTDELCVKRRAVAWYLLACRGEIDIRLFPLDWCRAQTELAARAGAVVPVDKGEHPYYVGKQRAKREAVGLAGAEVILANPGIDGDALLAEARKVLVRDLKAQSSLGARHKFSPLTNVEKIPDTCDLLARTEDEHLRCEALDWLKRNSTDKQREALVKRLHKETHTESERAAYSRLMRRLKRHADFKLWQQALSFNTESST